MLPPRFPKIGHRNATWLASQIADEEIARRTGHTFAAVRTRRISRSIKNLPAL
jgi:hypothetical protein